MALVTALQRNNVHLLQPCLNIYENFSKDECQIIRYKIRNF